MEEKIETTKIDLFKGRKVEKLFIKILYLNINYIKIKYE